MGTMRHRTCSYEEFLIYGLAVALAITMVLAPDAARSGAYVSDPLDYFGPRWSNNEHIERGLIAGAGCVALPPGASAEYIPGRDARGRPVLPADTPKSFNNNFPVGVDVDVKVGTKQIAGQQIDLYAGRFAFDPATNELSLNGRVWQRDCFPLPK